MPGPAVPIPTHTPGTPAACFNYAVGGEGVWEGDNSIFLPATLSLSPSLGKLLAWPEKQGLLPGAWPAVLLGQTQLIRVTWAWWQEYRPRNQRVVVLICRPLLPPCCLTLSGSSSLTQSDGGTKILVSQCPQRPSLWGCPRPQLNIWFPTSLPAQELHTHPLPHSPCPCPIPA